jgi:glycosyltransferase involved in cell wall biosynthesis
MRVAYVTRWFPYESVGEEFLEPEVRSLSRGLELVLIPTRPPKRTLDFDLPGTRQRYQALANLDVWLAAAREVARHPAAVARAAWRVFGPGYSVRSKLVNLTVFPKGLALAESVREIRADHIHVHWLTAPSTAAYVASMLTGVPWSMTAHSHDIFADNLTAQKVTDARFTRVISRRNCEHLKERLPAAVRERCAVVFLGVEVPERIVEPPSRIPRILAAARLTPVKGHRYLLEALGKLAARGVDFRCDLVGDGPLRDELETLARNLGIAERVAFLGRLPHDVMLARLNAAEWDISVMSSTETGNEFEGIPVALTEAAAAGIPIVASQTGSIPEIVTPENGLLFPQRDPERFADALQTLLLDPELRRRMGRAGRARVEEFFRTEATSRAVLRLFGVEAAPPAIPFARRPASASSSG